MAINGDKGLSRFLADKFTPEWKLLSQTEKFVSCTPEFLSYEQQFQAWRQRLQNRTTADTELVTIRSEIVSLRQELRLKGYDLSIGEQRLELQGFRNDDCLADGFQRVVVCFCKEQTYFRTGSANHIAITEELLAVLVQKKLLRYPEIHYLWYLRTRSGLILSGSATETPVDFERLAARAQANSMKLLSALRSLT